MSTKLFALFPAALITFVVLLAPARAAEYGAKASSPGQGLSSFARLPRGVFSLTPARAEVSDEILASSLVAGVSLRDRWQEVEPSEGAYDWSYLRTEMQLIAEAGKKILLRLTSGGRNTPSWVIAGGAQPFTFIDDNPYHDSYQQQVTIPVFWDPVFLQKKKSLIVEMGRLFADQPNLALVSASCANATTDDWNVPDGDRDIESWLDLGYTPEKLIDACEEIIETTMEAFPQQYVLLAVGRNRAKLDPDPDYVARAVAAFASSRYPGRLIVQKNSLSAATPDPWLNPEVGAWQILLDSPFAAGQMLAPATSPTCRMSGGVTPCDAQAVLQQAVTIGSHYRMLYQEIYEKDILSEGTAEAVRFAAETLKPPSIPLRLRLILGARAKITSQN